MHEGTSYWRAEKMELTRQVVNLVDDEVNRLQNYISTNLVIYKGYLVLLE
jgi:hypothetical protein